MSRRRMFRRVAALVGRFAGPLYALAVIGTIVFVLYVGATARP